MTFFKLFSLCMLAAIPWETAGAGLKPHPAGIIRLFSVDFSRPENLPAWTNANLDGMRIRADWNDVQPATATYDWSGMDKVLALGAQHDKLIGMSVAAGIFTPQWVYGAGAARYAIQDGTGFSMPVPWDDAFLAQWLDFVRALGARYDGNPALGYVVMSGMGQIVETYVAQTDLDTTRLSNRGGPSAWIIAAKKVISTYAKAFPTTPFYITAAKPFHTGAGLAALQEVIDWGVATYPGRFGIMTASLHAMSNLGYYPNLAISTYRSSQPVGFQTLCSEATDAARLQGTLAQVLRAGVRLGGNFVEVYQKDADAAAQQAGMRKWGAALKLSVPPVAPSGPSVTIEKLSASQRPSGRPEGAFPASDSEKERLGSLTKRGLFCEEGVVSGQPIFN